MWRKSLDGCCLLPGECFRRFGIPIPLDLGIGCGPLKVDLLPIGQSQTEAISLSRQLAFDGDFDAADLVARIRRILEFPLPPLGIRNGVVMQEDFGG